eukprot:PhF_6_TR40193/c0_g1_i1/m.59635
MIVSPLSFSVSHDPAASTQSQPALRHNGMELPTLVVSSTLSVPEELTNLRNHTAVMIPNGDLVVIGGRTYKTNESSCSVYLLSVYEDELQPSTKTVNQTRLMLGGPLTADSHHSHTSVLTDDKIYVLGGLSYVHTVHGIVWDPVFYAISTSNIEDVEDLSHTLTMSSKMKVPRRRGHSSVVHGECMYVYGGWGSSAEEWVRDIDVYSFATRKWLTPKETRGGFPPGVAHHSSSVCNGTMYVFGGYCDASCTRQKRAAMEKTPIKFNHSKIVFGVPANSKSSAGAAGYHIPCGCDVDGSTNSNYVPHPGEGGSMMLCSNALFCYTFMSREWKFRQCLGEVPDPRAHHAACMCEGRLLITGGEGESVFNDVYVLDLAMLLWTRIDFESVPRALTGHSIIMHGHRVITVGGSPFSTYHQPTHFPNDRQHLSEAFIISKMIAYSNVKRHLAVSQLKASEGDAKPKLVLRKESQILRNVARMSITKLVRLDETLLKAITSPPSAQKKSPDKRDLSAMSSSSPVALFPPRAITPAEAERITTRLYQPQHYDDKVTKLQKHYPVLKTEIAKKPLSEVRVQKLQERFYYSQKSRTDERLSRLMHKYIVDEPPTRLPVDVIDTSVNRMYSDGMKQEEKTAQKLVKKYYNGTTRSLSSQQGKRLAGADEVSGVVERLTVSAQQQRSKSREKCFQHYVTETQPMFPKVPEEERKKFYEKMYEEGLLTFKRRFSP